MNLIELMAHGKRCAEETLEKNGRIISLLNVHMSKNVVLVFDFKVGGQFENVVKSHICDLITTARARGQFEGALMFAEVWISTYQGKNPNDAPLPSKDPNRQEAVIVCAWDGEGNKKVLLYRIDRSGVGVRLGPLRDMGATDFQTFLDSAFVTPEKIIGGKN